MTIDIVATNKNCILKIGEFEILCVRLTSPSIAASGKKADEGEVLVYARDLAEILHVDIDDFDAAIDFNLGSIPYFPIPDGTATSVPGFKLKELPNVVDAIAEECDWTRASELRTELMKAVVFQFLNGLNNAKQN